MSETPKFPIGELIKAGTDAPRVLVRHIVETEGPKAASRVYNVSGNRDHYSADQVEELVDRLIASQITLARAQGAGAGAVATAAEMGALLAGPAAGVAAAVAVMLADLTALSWIQVRLSLMIAAAYGHDLTDLDARSRELLVLHGLDTAIADGGGPVVAKGARAVALRLLNRYLRGNTLKAITSMFRFVGIKFSRAALVRGLPLINVPANAAVADVTTRRSAAKVRKYYRQLPVSRPSQ